MKDVETVYADSYHAMRNKYPKATCIEKVNRGYRGIVFHEEERQPVRAVDLDLYVDGQRIGGDQ